MSVRHASLSSNVSSRSYGWGKRAVRKVHFTLLVCGRSGTGKTAFIETLFGKRSIEMEPISPKAPGSNMELRATTVELEEEDASRLVVTVIDTPGFGDAIDSTNDIQHLAQFIQMRFDEVLAEESRIRRNPKFKDNRVHACLYFIEPSSHGLSELDILTMHHLGNLVNIIPVLSRADQLTVTECRDIKKIVLEDIKYHKLAIFDFGADSEEADDNDDYLDAVASVRCAMPFAVISNTEYTEDGSPLYRRKLMHGSIDITDAELSDFALLRDSMFSVFLSDLKDVTSTVLYEAYRTTRLSETSSGDGDGGANRSSLLSAEELAEHANRLKEMQLRRESELLRESENKIAREIEERKRQLMEREMELREMEARLERERGFVSSLANSHPLPTQPTPVADLGGDRDLERPSSATRRAVDSRVASRGTERSEDYDDAADYTSQNANKAELSSGFASSTLSAAPTTLEPPAVLSQTRQLPGTPKIDTSRETLSGLNGGSRSEPDLPPRSPNRPLSFVGRTSPLQIKKPVRDDMASV